MSVSLKFGARAVGGDNPAFIIAEIGQNHQGDINIAKELIKKAKQCGVDCVKFQKTCISEKFNKKALERPYSSENSWGATYGDHKKYLEFTNEEFVQLQSYAKQWDVLFTASAMDEKSLYFLQSIKVPFVKIGSGDSNNLVLIEQAANTNVPLVISTGMQEFDGVKRIYNCVSRIHKNFALLHCVSAYPTPLKDLNLRAISLFKDAFPDVVIGYSGHENGVDPSVAAVALGAKIVERHITLDKNQKGSDHICSLEPQDLVTLVTSIRETELALGRPIKEVQKSELPCYEKLGKTVITTKCLKKGHVLTACDLKIKVAEPKGVDASLINELIGKCINVDIGEDESITQDCVE